MRFSPETKRGLHELGDLTIFDMLASTEGGGFAVTTTTGVGDLPGRPKLFPTAVVLDENMNEVQDRPGALGVLAQRGALPLGYHGDREKTEATFPVIGGVRHVVPGDWVRVEDDRHIEFLGRGSGVINTGGEKVYPLEVEEALLSHPAVTMPSCSACPTRGSARSSPPSSSVRATCRPRNCSRTSIGCWPATSDRDTSCSDRRWIAHPPEKSTSARLRDEVVRDRDRADRDTGGSP